MSIKDEFEKLYKERGFNSVRAVALAAGIDVANLWTNIRGTWKLSIERAFKLANTLGVPIMTIMEIFYKDEIAENNRIISEN